MVRENLPKPYPEDLNRQNSRKQQLTNRSREELHDNFEMPDSLLSIFHNLLKQFGPIKGEYIIWLFVMALVTYGYMRVDKKDAQNELSTHSTVEVIDQEGEEIHEEKNSSKIYSIDELFEKYGKMELADYHRPDYDLKKKPMNFTYNTKGDDSELKLLNFPKISEKDKIKSWLSTEEKMIRCLRRKPITDAVEDRYDIPRWLLLALMAQEWMGDPTLINVWMYNDDKITKSDWWAGLIHIQAANAVRYGLRVYKQKNIKLKKMADNKHGEQLINLYYNKKQNVLELAKQDERFHPVAAIDVAARFLCNNSLSSWEEKIIAYHTGLGNRHIQRWKRYLQNVLLFRASINGITGDKIPDLVTLKTIKANDVENIIQLVEKWKKNMKVKIDGEEWGYEEYMDYFKDSMEDDYNLSKYKKIKK